MLILQRKKVTVHGVLRALQVVVNHNGIEHQYTCEHRCVIRVPPGGHSCVVCLHISPLERLRIRSKMMVSRQ